MKGKELEFISQIERDGSAVIDVSNDDMSSYDNDYFKMNSLSITQKTFVACGFNSFVVKIK